MKVYQGKLTFQGGHFGIVVARSDDFVSSRLLEGAKDALSRHGVKGNDWDVVWVPGVREIPLIAKELALTGKYDAVIALGVVPSEKWTDAQGLPETAAGALRVGLEQRVPVIWEVSLSGSSGDGSGVWRGGNRGAEAAVSALEMVNLLREIRIVGEE
ncbi:MAG: 6,7-dimethyl-8-ribityllumazine synthase [Dethiosulfovibrio peptidovorans]|nr:MAG: 6,7-dimethyl-8-ribityllumazine synthase [Dethiosulfovibrio peptidovorans]